jgi:DNA-binding NarL/FixJ family response regulator
MKMDVFIVDKDCEACERMAAVLAAQDGLHITGCATTFVETLPQLNHCDLVLVNANLLENAAYQLCRAGYRMQARAKIIVFGKAETSGDIVRYLEAGAKYYLNQDVPVEQWAPTLRSIYCEELMFPAPVGAALLSRLAELSDWVEALRLGSSNLNNLTRREREVLRLIGHDYTNQDIANHLIIKRAVDRRNSRGGCDAFIGPTIWPGNARPDLGEEHRVARSRHGYGGRYPQPGGELAARGN